MIDAVQRRLGTRPCDCGRCGEVTTRNVAVGPEIHRTILETAGSRDALIFGDAATLAAGAVTLAAIREGSSRTRVVDLTPDVGILHACDRAVSAVRSVLTGLGDDVLAVAVGAGTINDVVKAAAHDLDREYLCCATAASMNGYTSTVAAITVDGLKSTLPSAPPSTIVAHPAVLSAAPADMTRAGLADLLSKPVSSADWLLTHLLWGDPYCPTPVALAGEAVERAVAAVPGLNDGEPDATEVLFEALLLSGISMAVAGSSSPASGGEHLISHFLDMTAAHAADGPRETALHGLQVGVGTRITTRLYRALLARHAQGIDWSRAERVAPTAEQARQRLQSDRALPKRLRELFLEQTGRKFERIGDPQSRIARIRRCWPELQERLAPSIDEACRYGPALDRIGAPATAEQIGTTTGELRRALLLGRFIRDRYTVLDLADDLGLLDELAPVVLP